MDPKQLTIKLLVLPFVVIYVFSWEAVDGEEITCIEKERKALLRFKKDIIDEYNVLSSWGSEEAKWECCKWNGILCSNRTGHVISLKLVGVEDHYGYSGLRGNISSSLLELHHLTRLDLSYNNFSGKEIPEFIGSLKQLKHLNLTSCRFRGIIPHQLGNLTNLRTLDLGYNYGLKIDNLNWLSLHLTLLDLNYNKFSGKEIPEFIGSLKQLKHLNLRSCGLGGIVPHQLGNLTNLRTLDLGYNYGLKIDNLSWLSLHSSLFLLDLSDVNFTQSFETVVLQYILKLPSLRELHLSSSEFPNVTSSFDAFVNSTSPLSILDLSITDLTSLAFRWLFNVTKNLVRLDLSGNKLDGSIPDAFGKLIFLEDLDLSGNRLEGGIPKSMWNLSRLHTLVASNNLLKEPLSNSFHNLSGEAEVLLQILDLSYNQITGSFPDLRAFSVLRKLNLNNNKLKDVIPLTVWQLSKLENLDVSYNSLEGTILEANISKLHSLKVLALSFNSLAINLTHNWVPPFQLDVISLARCSIGPRFPAWLQTQSSLSLLDLSFNNISEELPKWIWDFSFRLDDLDLSHNQIRGKLPNLFSKYILAINFSFNNFSGLLSKFHPNTQCLQLSNNMFEGSLSSLCTTAYVRLLVLDLSNNQLSGALPNCWENMTTLMVLDLANNNFSEEIPHNLGSLKDLLRLHLRNNSLSGVLPSSLKKCQSLAMIDVGDNKLTGNIPAWIGSHLTRLNILSIRGNRFDGSIPPELCRLTGIQILDLSRNNISGRIPSQCFNNSTFLPQNIRHGVTRFGFSIDRSHNINFNTIDNALVQWKQQEFEYRKTLGFLTLVDLSSNRFVGDIPPEIFQMRGLISLNLSGNYLTGNISSDIGNMGMLECLDLSRNHLSGKIPTSLGKLTFLSVLDVSNNNFSGEIPQGTQLQSFNASVYAGNIDLCGFPLPRCPEDGLNTSAGNHGKHNDGDDNITTQSILQEFYLPVVLDFIVGFWGITVTLILNKSWRYAYFNSFNKITDWLYVKAAIHVARLR